MDIWTKKVKDGATRQEEKWKTMEKIGCSDGGHAEGWCEEEAKDG